MAARSSSSAMRRPWAVRTRRSWPPASAMMDPTSRKIAARPNCSDGGKAAPASARKAPMVRIAVALIADGKPAMAAQASTAGRQNR